MNTYRPWLVAALFFGIAIPLTAQNGQIDGELFGADGTPLADGQIIFDQQEDELTASTNMHYELKSDSRGRFVHVSIVPGAYRITIQINGRPQAAGIARISPGVNEMRLNLQREEIEFYEFSRQLGTFERVVRKLSMLGASAGEVNPFVTLAPADDKGREEVTEREAAMRKAFDAGRAALAAKDYNEAIRQFTLAAEGNTTQHVVFANLALAYEMTDRYKEAIQNYEEAQKVADSLGLPPAQTNYFQKLTLVYALSGDIAKAMEYADRAAAIDPSKSAQSFYNVGVVLTNRGNNAGAAEAFKRAIEADAKMPDAYLQLAIAYFADSKTIADAVPVLRKYLELAPKAPDAETARALLEAAAQK